MSCAVPKIHLILRKNHLKKSHGPNRLVIRDSMKLQHGYCFPDFANSNTFLSERNGCFKNMRISIGYFSSEKNKSALKNSFLKILAKHLLHIASFYLQGKKFAFLLLSAHKQYFTQHFQL